MQMAMKIVEMRIMPRVTPQELTASPGKHGPQFGPVAPHAPLGMHDLNIIVDSRG
jgi:hypothetical protein